MSNPLSGITNIRPTYPVRPVQPSKDDSQSGQRHTPPPKKPSDDKQEKPASVTEKQPDDELEDKPGREPDKQPETGSAVVIDGTDDGKEPTIDEYI